jgi:Xaa-Pro aminopeptidase
VSTTQEQRLSALRGQLAAQGLHGFVVPLTDEHMSEYVGGYAKRLEWLTGFTGSAGSAVVLADKAAIFIDGRYTLQVKDQVPEALYAHVSVPESSVAAWLKDAVSAGQRIGYDPWFHTKAWVTAARASVEAAGGTLVAVEANPVDAIWTDRPAPSLAPLTVQDEQLAGQSSAAKRQAMGDAIAKLGADVAVVAALDSIAWLLNVRGADVTHTPVPRSYVLLHADGTATLFCEPEKLTDAVRAHLGNAVAHAPRAAFAEALAALGKAGKRVLVDPEWAVAAISEALAQAGATVIDGKDPTILARARKTPAEVAGTRAAHVRDGAAISRFLHWLSEAAPAGSVDELSAEDQLLAFRQATGALVDLSFAPISGAGPNGAIVHYRSTPATNRPLRTGELYLIDSGGQYRDGTTDITRTIAVGPAGAEERARFTRVLKGHIALATARFPKGTSGRNLDTLARLALWQVGLDYDHGTGHGVGSFLAVHEGPQRIAKAGSDVALEPGMIISNEPGYYKTGAYGIRIENLVLVQSDVRPDDERDMFAFETLTLAPIDRALIDASLLSAEERDWLNAYHARVRSTLSPLVPPQTAQWLDDVTRPIG